MTSPTQTSKTRHASLLGAFSSLSGIFAVIGASCCVLPILLLNLGVGVALAGKLAMIARYQDWFLAIGLVFLLVGLLSLFRQRARPSRVVIAMYVLAIILIIGAFIIPHFEATLIRWVR